MDFKEGDEIVLSIMEHHSNIVPWHFHRERKGCVLKWAPISDEGEFLLDEFEQLLTQRTKMVAITHMSNVLGTVVPIKEVVRIAHARGVPVLVDGAQAAVHMPIDVQDLDCDFYAFTGHKTYGPTGIGVLYAKRKHLDAMPPYQGGGEMIESVHREQRHLRQAAAQVRGRHAADRAGDRARRRAGLHDAGRARAHRRPRGDAQGLRARAAGPAQLAQDPRARQGQGRHRLVQHRRACTRTTSPPSSTARAWRCGPATTARSR